MSSQLILVNGASSAGKSTLCRALQPALPQPFLYFSPDLFLFGNVLPRDSDGKLRNWAQIRPQIFEGFNRCLPALLDAGNSLLVDIVLEHEAQATQLDGLLLGYDVFRVGLFCPIEELERRERARGDRRIGDARRDVETVHTYMTYDIQVECTTPMEQNVARIVAHWQRR